jgi:drug/metabolite transporter (DMT)-like permease
VGPAFALGSSLTYGVSDFPGGTTSRRIGTLQFIFFTQLIGVLLAAGWVVISSEPVPRAVAVAAAAGAGLGLAVGVAAFFQAMVVGKMSVVAPISATGVVLPVAVGIARGEHPSAAQAVGIVAAIAGVALATLHAQLVVVSVLGSLYPAVTGLLAYRVLGERLSGSQLVGIAAVLSGVALLST